MESERCTNGEEPATFRDCPGNYNWYNAYSSSSQITRWPTESGKLNACTGQDWQH